MARTANRSANVRKNSRSPKTTASLTLDESCLTLLVESGCMIYLSDAISGTPLSPPGNRIQLRFDLVSKTSASKSSPMLSLHRPLNTY
jgi:hypothetical protein